MVEIDSETWSRIQRRAREESTDTRTWIAGAIRDQTSPVRAWVRDLGVVLLAMGLCLAAWTQATVSW